MKTTIKGKDIVSIWTIGSMYDNNSLRINVKGQEEDLYRIKAEMIMKINKPFKDMVFKINKKIKYTYLEVKE